MCRQARIMMNVHVRVGFVGLDVFTPSTLSNPSPHEQPFETSQLEQLKIVAKAPFGINYGDWKLPYWDSLRGDPRFEEIVASLAPK